MVMSSKFFKGNLIFLHFHLLHSKSCSMSRVYIGTGGNNLIASLIQFSRYLSSLRSSGVHGRSESPKILSFSDFEGYCGTSIICGKEWVRACLGVLLKSRA